MSLIQFRSANASTDYDAVIVHASRSESGDLNLTAAQELEFEYLFKKIRWADEYTHDDWKRYQYLASKAGLACIANLLSIETRAINNVAVHSI